MNIFIGIPTGDSYASIQMAVNSIAQRARFLREQGLLEPPWSLVELRPDNEDFAWLCDWMRQLPSGVAKRCLEDGQWRKFEVGSQRISYTTGIGTLLLQSATEVARRATDERSLWAGISRDYFSETTRKLLFARGYPSHTYKDAVEQAARWLELRHVFGMQGLQNWYDTIYLQFGFSRQGMSQRMPEWLAGWGETFSVQHLLQGPRMRSESFALLWEALRLFQRGNCTVAQLLTILGESPWILPEWANDLVRLARERPRLRDGSGIISESSEEGEAPFLDTPLLRWDISSPPHFICLVKNLARLDLQDDTYDIVIAGQVCGRLHRRADGSYQVTPSDEIELPTIAPQVAASLIATDGQIVQNLTLQLWGENEDVTAFYKSNGRRFDPWKNVMRPSSEVLLLLTDDLTLEPPARYWHVFKQHGVRLYYLPSGWSDQTHVLLDDQVLWQPNLSSLPTKSADQALASQIRISLLEQISPIALGDYVRLRITLPTNTDIAFLRAFGQPIEYERLSTNEILTEGIAITPRSFSYEECCRIELSLGVKTGAKASGQRNVTHLHAFAEVPITGAAVLTPKGWAALRPDETLEREQVSMQPVKVFLMEIDKWDVLEGDVWVRHLSQHPKPLTALSGYGAPLKLSQGVYNMYREPRKLAREVVDHGSLVKVDFDAPNSTDSLGGVMSIRLARPIEPSERHTIHWWDRRGDFKTFAPEWSEVQDEGIWWRASIPVDLTEPLAIAIAYNGTRLGSWWDERWNTAIRRPMLLAPQTTAALLRWFHLPVLSQRYLLDVRSFFSAYPGETLAAWVSKSGLPPELQWSEIDDGWLSVMRTIFWNWRPSNIPAQQIILQVLPESANQNLPDALRSITWKLLRVSPVLMALLVKQWALEEGIAKWGAEMTGVLLQQLIYDVAESQGRNELQRKIIALEEDVATTMDVDRRFVERSLIKRAGGLLLDPPTGLSQLDQDNLAIAMNVEPFRRLLGIKLLELISQSIK